MKNATKEFERLLEIMDKLRAECPWDKKQTLESLRKLTIEETYELAEAIMNNDLQEIKKELGDLMLHIVFYSKIGQEQNEFEIADVLSSINEKLIYRHPHIFSDVKVNDDEDVKRNWEALKLKEKEQVWDKVYEEIEELKTEILNGTSKEKIEGEFGDLFFSLINAARLYDIEPENALERTNRKFIKRFNYLEEKTLHLGKSLHDMSLDEMNEIWEQSKKHD